MPLTDSPGSSDLTAFRRQLMDIIGGPMPPAEDLPENELPRRADAAVIKYQEAAVDYLIETYYTKRQREMRYCHPVDILHQVYTYCTVLELPLEITNDAIDAAARNYFALL